MKLQQERSETTFPAWGCAANLSANPSSFRIQFRIRAPGRGSKRIEEGKDTVDEASDREMTSTSRMLRRSPARQLSLQRDGVRGTLSFVTLAAVQ